MHESPLPQQTGMSPEQVERARATVANITVSSNLAQTPAGGVEGHGAMDAAGLAAAKALVERTTVSSGAPEKDLKSRADEIFDAMKTPQQRDALEAESSSLIPAARGDFTAAQQHAARERQREITAELRRSHLQTDEPNELRMVMTHLGIPSAIVNRYVANATEQQRQHPSTRIHVTFGRDRDGKMILEPMIGFTH